MAERREILRQLLRSARFRVRGQCMETPPNGWSVRVEKKEMYWPGDVVVVDRGDHWQMHRFLGYRPSRGGLAAWTQADRSAEPDTAFLTERLIGRAEVPVRFSERVRAVARYARAWIARGGGPR